jgi:hypothetical protein
MKPGQGSHGHGHGHGHGHAHPPKPPSHREEPGTGPSKAAGRKRTAFLRGLDPFKVGVGLALGLGLTLGLTAWGVQTHRAKLADRHARLDETLRALATALKAHPDPPFRPTLAYLARLRDLAATRSALGHLDPGEGHPDADRQTLLEGELAEILGDLDRLRAAGRDPRVLKDLRRAYGTALADLGALRQRSSLEPPAWEAELARACAAEGLPPSALQDPGPRLDRVDALAQELEELLGQALMEAKVLEQPGLEVVSFLPVPDRTILSAGGWQASGVGHDGRDPGRMITFSLEGTSLVHRLLNAGTWASLAKVGPGPQGGRRYSVDAACLRITEQGARRATRVIELAQALAQAWKAANPLAPAPTFTAVPRKTFEDIYTDVEPDAALGTPDGKPDLDHWPTAGELATVKAAFGPGEDLVLLRHTVAKVPHLWVLAREGVTYTSGGDGPADRLALLPGGLMLRLAEVEVPAVVGTQAFTVVHVLGRPRVVKRP